MQNILNKFNLDKNKLLLIGIALIVIIGIPLTIMQSQKQQEIRQRASEDMQEQPPGVALKFVRTDVDPDSEKKDIRINGKFPVEIRLINNQELDISAFTIIINYDSESLQLSKFSPEPKNAIKGGFDPIIIQDSTPGILQYTAVNSDIEIETNDQDILIGTLTFKAIKEADDADVKLDQLDTQVTALGKETALLVDFQDQETHKIVPIPEGSIAVDLIVKIDGISADTPAEIPRPFKIRPVGEETVVLTENLTFDTESASFRGQTHIPQNFTPGNYTIQARKTLRKFIGFLDPSQEEIIIPQINLPLGDVDEDNKIDILDFNIIRDCFGNLFRSGKCMEHALHLNADLDEDGEVTGVDYNLFLRSLAIREGD